MKKSVVASAPGKVNTYLAVGPPTEDGYHPLTSVFQAISLREWVELEPVAGAFEDEGVVSVRTVGYVPSALGEDPTFDPDLTLELSGLDPRTHLAARAVRAVFERASSKDTSPASAPPKRSEKSSTPLPAVKITVHKTIPVAGGMAGGSADAAAALVAANKMVGSPFSDLELQHIGRDLGADVPACLVGGLALGLRRGDRMERLTPGTDEPSRSSWWWVATVFEWGLRTPEVFKQFDTIACRRVTGHSAPTPALQGDQASTQESRDRTTPGETMDEETLSVLQGSPSQGVHALRNDLTGAAYRLRPELAKTHLAMLEAGCVEVMLSGSGPTLVGLAENEDAAVEISARLKGSAGVRETFPMWGPTKGARVGGELPSWCVSDAERYF